MRTTGLLVARLALLALPGAVHAADEARTVADAEFAFAQAAKEIGVQAAFLKFLAPESVLCSPLPVAGIESTRSRPPPPGPQPTLEWYPVLADVAGSDDLGYTTGPWVFRSGDGQSERYGTVLSVWRRQPDGAWRVVLDCGVPHEKAPLPPPMTSPEGNTAGAPAAAAGSPALLPLESWRDTVAAAEQRFAAAAARDGALAAFARFAAPEVRVLAPGALPAQGLEGARALLRERRPGRHFQHAFARDSRDGTLGYAWGFYGARGAARPEALYVHVWRRAETRAPWRIAAQVLQPLPPEQP